MTYVLKTPPITGVRTEARELIAASNIPLDCHGQRIIIDARKTLAAARPLPINYPADEPQGLDVGGDLSPDQARKHLIHTGC